MNSPCFSQFLSRKSVYMRSSPTLSAVPAILIALTASACGSSGYLSPDGTPIAIPSPDAPAPSPSPAPTTAPTTSTAFADCYGNTALQVPGNTYEVDSVAYINTGITHVYSSRYTVVGADTFKGNAVLHTHIESLESGALLASTTEQYTTLDAVSNSTYGAVVSTFLQGVGNPSLTISYSPAVSYPLNLAPGASFTQTYTTTSESSTPLLPPPPLVTQTTTKTFIGNESVTVPAGTFIGCRTDISTVTNGVTTTSTEWVVGSGPYRGLFLQSRDRTTLTQATLYFFNGV
jgi:hypothetical protein